MGGSRKHVAHLHFHDQRHCNQEYGQYVLHHDEHLAEHHLAAAAQRALDHINRFIAGGDKGGEQSADRAQDKDSCKVSSNVPWCHHKGNPDCRIVESGGKQFGILHHHQAVHHGSEQVCKQQRRCEADCGESHGFADVLPKDAGFPGTQKAPGGHLPGAFPGKCQAQVHIVEYGRQQEQQDNHRQEPEHLEVADAGSAGVVSGVEEGLVHSVRVPFIHALRLPDCVVILMQQVFHLTLDLCQGGILPYPVPGGIIADAVERLGLSGRPAARDMGDDVGVNE